MELGSLWTVSLPVVALSEPACQSGAMRGLIRQQVQKGGAAFFYPDSSDSDFAVAANLKLSRFLTPKMRPNYPLLQSEGREGGEAASFRAWANSRMDRRTSEVIGEGWN